MSRTASRERSQRMRERMQELPREKRGKLNLLLLGNALITVGIQYSWLALVLRAGRAVVGRGDYRPGPAARTAWSPALALASALLVVRRLGNPMVLRRLDRWMSQEGATDSSSR